MSFYDPWPKLLVVALREATRKLRQAGKLGPTQLARKVPRSREARLLKLGRPPILPGRQVAVDAPIAAGGGPMLEAGGCWLAAMAAPLALCD